MKQCRKSTTDASDRRGLMRMGTCTLVTTPGGACSTCSGSQRGRSKASENKHPHPPERLGAVRFAGYGRSAHKVGPRHFGRTRARAPNTRVLQ